MRSNYHESHVIECAFVLAGDSVLPCVKFAYIHITNTFDVPIHVSVPNERKKNMILRVTYSKFRNRSACKSNRRKEFLFFTRFPFLSATCERIFLLDKRVFQCLTMTYLCVWNFLNLKTSFSLLFHRVSLLFDRSSCLYFKS